MDKYRLHPNVKIDSFRKMRKIIGTNNFEYIKVTQKQYKQYYKLLTGKDHDGQFGKWDMLSIFGIKLIFQ